MIRGMIGNVRIKKVGNKNAQKGNECVVSNNFNNNSTVFVNNIF